jgi:hypothetical protein
MLTSGTLLQNRYRIIRQIGGGGQALVYLAEDTNLGSLRAIKELTPDPNASPQERQAAYDQFQREARILAGLNHPNLARVWDHFRISDNAYLVMDYIDGQTLQEILDQTSGFLPEAAVLRWAGQLCDVLDYLHRQHPPIIFRDLKPSNVMLDHSDTVKLIDFGIVRHFRAGKIADTVSMGTPGYAPLEQHGQGQTDARSDIYALGATLYHLLTQHEPEPAPARVLPGQPDPLQPARAHNSRIRPTTEAALTKAMAVNPAQRFQSALEMKRALLEGVRRGLEQGAKPFFLTAAVAMLMVVVWAAVRMVTSLQPTRTPTVAATNTVTATVVATPVPDQVQVPDLAGLSQEEARRLVEKAGLQLAVVGETHDSSIPALNVIAQTPPAGQMVRRGETIGVVISQGPSLVSVPAVEGLPITAAEPGLREMGLDISQKGIWSKETEGTILSQEPSAGSIVSEGSVVTLIISSGPRLMLNANLDNKVLLMACDLENDSLKPGETLRLTLYWRAL